MQPNRQMESSTTPPSRAHIFWQMPLPPTSSNPLHVADALARALQAVPDLPQVSVHLWAPSNRGSIHIGDPGLGPQTRCKAVDQVVAALGGGRAAIVVTVAGVRQYTSSAAFGEFELEISAALPADPVLSDNPDSSWRR